MEISFEKLSIKHAKDMFEYASDEETVKYLTFEAHRSLKDTKEAIERITKHDDIFAIVLNEVMIGTASLQNKTNKKIEFGVVINKDYWGRGIAKLALNYILQRWKQEYSNLELTAFVETNNKKSNVFFEKTNFKKIASTEKLITYKYKGEK